MCIESQTGVSLGCLMCLNDDVQCAIMDCFTACIPSLLE